MNTLMWEHKLTAQQLVAWKELVHSFSVVGPVSKLLACADEGKGALAEVDDVVKGIEAFERVVRERATRDGRAAARPAWGGAAKRRKA